MDPLQIEYRAPSQLKPHPRNARTHSKKQIRQIAESVRQIQDPDLTVPAIASQERLTIGYLSRLLRLPSLAPDIVTAIINGKHPREPAQSG